MHPQYQFMKFINLSNEEVEKFIENVKSDKTMIIPSDIVIDVKTYKNVNVITVKKLQTLQDNKNLKDAIQEWKDEVL